MRKIGSVGIVPPNTRVEVVDLETGEQVMPVGERGEIRVKGAQFTTGYRNRPDDNKQSIRNGWLYTGDIGYYDSDGYLFLVDRKKEMIIVGGYNVYPREIDELLFKHPAILEAATVGVPDSFSGEAVKAFVVLRPNAMLTAEELQDYCRQSLVKYKVPTKVDVRRRAAALGCRQDQQAGAEAAGLRPVTTPFARHRPARRRHSCRMRRLTREMR